MSEDQSMYLSTSQHTFHYLSCLIIIMIVIGSHKLGTGTHTQKIVPALNAWNHRGTHLLRILNTLLFLQLLKPVISINPKLMSWSGTPQWYGFFRGIGFGVLYQIIFTKMMSCLFVSAQGTFEFQKQSLTKLRRAYYMLTDLR